MRTLPLPLPAGALCAGFLCLATLSAQATLLKDIRPGRQGSGSGEFASTGKLVFFAADDGTLGSTLWRSDGSIPGTFYLRTTLRNPKWLTPVGDLMFFSADDGPLTGDELWVSDGTSAGTRVVKDLRPGSIDSTEAIVASHNGLLYFFASAQIGSSNRRGLWVTDGTTAGTRELIAGNLGLAQYSLWHSAGLGKHLYFYQYSQRGGELWRTDGTIAGTQMITKQVTMPTATAGVHLGGSRMFFAGVEPSSAVRPWVTDGTAAGSQQLNSVGMTVTASFTYSMQRIGNGSLVAFHGWDANGAELWLTDGTVAGTKMAFDFSPGWRSGLPLFSFGRAGESYVMIADDNVVGYGRGEPYALPLSYFGAAFNEVYGEACNGTQGKPRLRGLGGAPTLGNANFALEISNGRPNAVTALLLSPSPASIPLPPCTLLVSLAGAQIETRLLDNNGRVVIPISVPNAVGLVGLDVYWQGVIIDPQGSFANNFAFTNGLRTMVGL